MWDIGTARNGILRLSVGNSGLRGVIHFILVIAIFDALKDGSEFFLTRFEGLFYPFALSDIFRKTFNEKNFSFGRRVRLI